MERKTSLDLDHSRGDKLLSSVLGGGVVHGEIANELLAEFHKGYPVSKLRLLLKARDEKAVAAGMWIASELGVGARPLFDDIAQLIRHPSPHVRFFALDCLVSSGRPEDEQIITSALDLVTDPDASVRWKALVFLATVPEDVLRTVQRAAMKQAPSSSHAKGLELIVSSITSHDLTVVTASLADSDPVLRRYAVAAAARIVHRDPAPLRHAMASEDTTIRQFAEDMIKRAGGNVPQRVEQ